MKLFVWRGIPNFSPGTAFALAEDKQQAIDVICSGGKIDKGSPIGFELQEKEPDVYDFSVGFYVGKEDRLESIFSGHGKD